MLRPTTLGPMARKSAATRSPRRNPPRSFTFPAELWQDVQTFARERSLPPAAAVRSLVSEQLRAVRDIEQLRRARQWQLEEAMREVRALEAGDRRAVPWSRLVRSYRTAVARAAAGAKRSAG